MSGQMERQTDMGKIVGIGACVMDTLITLPNYPQEDTKLRALGSKIAGGGPTATGIVAASKLGTDTGYIGVLSDDNGGTFLKSDFEKYHVDTTLIRQKCGYRSFTSVLWLSEENASRTCVFDKGNLPELVLDDEQKNEIEKADILMIDGNELSAAKEACLIANEAGTKVLYDAGGLYDGVEQILPLADILIPSEEFALGHTGCNSAEDAAKLLFDKYNPEVVVITMGKNGGIIYEGKEIKHYPAFKVNAIDSNGAGDVFHGAFAAGVNYGFNYFKCCCFASAVSAVKCTGLGARESVPDFATVKKFMEEHGYEL